MTHEKNSAVASQNANLAPFNPSSETAQLQSITLMDLRSDDILFDLGCGDGRLLVRAVSQVEGLRAVGVEIDPAIVERANKSIAALPKQDQERIQIRCEDVTKVLLNACNRSERATDASTTTVAVAGRLQDVPIEDATVIYLYLLPRGLLQIKPLLDDLVCRAIEKGRTLRFVAYTFQVKGWEPVKVDTSTKSGVPIYLYQFPK